MIHGHPHFLFFASQLVHHGSYHKRLCLVYPVVWILLDALNLPCGGRPAGARTIGTFNPKVVLMV